MKIKNILMIVDPVSVLKPMTDTSLVLGRILQSMGHHVFVSEIKDVSFGMGRVRFRAAELICHADKTFSAGSKTLMEDHFFDVILLRKEPPFDLDFLHLTYLLDRVDPRIPVINKPSSVRKYNEKLSALLFPEFIPNTLISADVESALDFYVQTKEGVVVKPIDDKWGNGVFKITQGDPEAKKLIRDAVKNGKQHRIFQEFVPGKTPRSEKRITVLNGEIFVSYEKEAPKNDFRSNIHRGGSVHRTRLTATEALIAGTVARQMAKDGIYFAGLDILSGKLLEINVTCPGALIESNFLYPKLAPLQKLADAVVEWAR